MGRGVWGGLAGSCGCEDDGMVVGMGTGVGKARLDGGEWMAEVRMRMREGKKLGCNPSTLRDENISYVPR